MQWISDAIWLAADTAFVGKQMLDAVQSGLCIVVYLGIFKYHDTMGA